MTRRLSLSFELQSTSNGVEYDTSNPTTPTISTTTKRTGAAALRCNPTATTSFITHTFMGTGVTGVRYARTYLYIASYPTANQKAIFLLRDNTNGNGPVIYLNSDGTLMLYDAQTATQQGSNSSALSLNTWYRIEFSYNYGTGAITARLDGTQFASGSSTASMDMNVMRLGMIDSATCDLYFDDGAINDDSGTAQNSWPGSGGLFVMRANNSGDANAFATQTGGTAGAANNYTRVNETTPNDATSFNGSSTLNQEDLFNFDPSGIGASDTVKLVEVWARFRNSTADTTAGIKFELEKASGGTILQSSELKPNSTTWRTNSINGATFRVPPIIAYTDPDGSAWTQSTLDTAQAGYKLVTAPGTAGRRIDVSYVALIVEYDPATGNNYQGTPSDSVSTSDALVKAVTKALSDSATPTDALVKSAAKPLADTATVTEAASKQPTKPVGTDSVTTSESSLRAVTKNPADSVSTSDAAVKSATLNKSDSATAADALSKQVSKPVAADSVSTSDASSRQPTKRPADTVSPSDANNKAVTKALSDAATTSEAASKQVGRTAADSVTTSDSLRKQPTKAPADSVTASDTPQRNVTKNLADAAAATEQASKQVTKPAADSVSTSDAVNLSTVVVITASDSVGVADVLKKSATLNKSESAGAADVAVKYVVLNKSEAVTLNDLLGKLATLRPADAATATDAERAQFTKALQDATAIIDNSTQSHGKTINLADVVSVQDSLTIAAKMPSFNLTVRTGDGRLLTRTSDGRVTLTTADGGVIVPLTDGDVTL